MNPACSPENFRDCRGLDVRSAFDANRHVTAAHYAPVAIAHAVGILTCNVARIHPGFFVANRQGCPVRMLFSRTTGQPFLQKVCPRRKKSGPQ